jgi:hypothetical protein
LSPIATAPLDRPRCRDAGRRVVADGGDGVDRALVANVAVRMTEVGHVVTHPGPPPHHELRMGDVAMLMLDTLASIRMRRRLVVLDPLAPLTCQRCREAYERAREIFAAAGGVEAWALKVTGRVGP